MHGYIVACHNNWKKADEYLCKDGTLTLWEEFAHRFDLDGADHIVASLNDRRAEKLKKGIGENPNFFFKTMV